MEAQIKIIITEDRLRWRQTIRKALEDFSIVTIAEAENGMELLKHLEEIRPDVILLDLAMPVMNGSETMEVLRIKHPAQKVIVMSLFDEPTLMDDYISRGAKGCFPKSNASNLEELVDAIRLVAKGGTYFNFEREEVKKFTSRQKEIITLISEGKSNKQIAEELKISSRGIEKQKAKIMEVLNVKSVTEMLSSIFELGLKYFRKPKKRNPLS